MLRSTAGWCSFQGLPSYPASASCRKAVASFSNAASSALTGPTSSAKASRALDALSNFLLIVSEAAAAGFMSAWTCSPSGAWYTPGMPFQYPTTLSMWESMDCPIDFSFPEPALMLSTSMLSLLHGKASGITRPSPDCGCSAITYPHPCSRVAGNRRNLRSRPRWPSGAGTLLPFPAARCCMRRQHWRHR